MSNIYENCNIISYSSEFDYFILFKILSIPFESIVYITPYKQEFWSFKGMVKTGKFVIISALEL